MSTEMEEAPDAATSSARLEEATFSGSQPPGTILVPLSRGKTAIVDEVDAWVLEWSWRALKSRGGGKWYAIRGYRIDGRVKTVYLHRAILAASTGGDRPDMLVDHINGDTFHCVRKNLRWSNRSESQRNRGKFSNNVSGIKGVFWYKDRSK
jgi:hypothetical protein